MQDHDRSVSTYQKEQHSHDVERINLDDPASGSASTDSNEVAAQNTAEARHSSIQYFNQSLMHASQCHDANCQLVNCQTMKHLMAHSRSCEQKASGGCPVCKQLMALCSYHAKHCLESNCPVPFCVTIKRKLQQQQQRLPMTSVAVQNKTAILSSTTSSATGNIQSTAGMLMLGGDTAVQLPDDVSTGQVQQNVVDVSQQMIIARQSQPPVMSLTGNENICWQSLAVEAACMSVQVFRELWIKWTSPRSVCNLLAKNCRAQPSLAQATPAPSCDRMGTLPSCIDRLEVWQ